MKALGTGLGAFALTDVEVCRTSGTGATRNAPFVVLHGGAAELAGAQGRGQLPPLADPHRRRGHRLRGGRADRRRVRAVLTRDEMRAADAAALAPVSHDTLVHRAGTAVAQRARCACWAAAPTAAGSSSWPARGTTAPTGGWRRRCWPGAGRGSRWWRPRARRRVLPACDLVIDGAYGTGFRGTYEAPRGPGGRRRAGHRHPLGRGRRQRGGARAGRAGRRTVTFAALKPGLLQGDGAALSGGVEVADIGIGFPTPQALAHGGRRHRRPAAGAAARANKWTHAVGVAAGSSGMEGAAMLCTRGAMAAGAGMIRLGSPGDTRRPPGRPRPCGCAARGGLGGAVPGGDGQVQGGGHRAGAGHGARGAARRSGP